jgi:hypothetical protein
VVFIIMSVVVALAAVLPLTVWLAASGPDDIIVQCSLWMIVVGSLAVLTFWLGLRRLSRDEQSQPDNSDSDPQPGRQTELHPPSEHADGRADDGRDREKGERIA